MEVEKLQQHFKNDQTGKNALFEQQSNKINQQETEIKNTKEQLKTLQVKLSSAEEGRKKFVNFAEKSLNHVESVMSDTSGNLQTEILQKSKLIPWNINQ